MCSTRVRTCMRVCLHVGSLASTFPSAFLTEAGCFSLRINKHPFFFHSISLAASRPGSHRVKTQFQQGSSSLLQTPPPPPPMSPPCLSPCSANLGYVMRCLKSFCNLLQLRRPRQRQPARCVSLQRRREPRVCFMKPIFLLFVC